jgi:hypothetical protein
LQLANLANKFLDLLPSSDDGLSVFLFMFTFTLGQLASIQKTRQREIVESKKYRRFQMPSEQG